MTRILAIDPGSETSGFVIYDAAARVVVSAAPKSSNEDLLRQLHHLPTAIAACDELAIGLAAAAIVILALALSGVWS